MQTLKTALVAGAIALASTVAFGQASSDPSKVPHNAGTDKGAAPPAATLPDADANAKAGVKAPGANATTGAEISDKNKTGSRPSDSTAPPADMNKTR